MKKFPFFFISFLCLFLSFNNNLKAQVNLNKGLMFFWPFNGNANDASGNGYNGSVNSGSLTTDRFGVPNAAYSFDASGSGQGIGISSISNSGYKGATISFWMKTSATVNEIKLYDGPPGVVYLNMYSTGHVIGSFDGTGNGKSTSDENTSQVNNNKWNNITCKSDGSTTYIYFNGKLETSYSSTQGNFTGAVWVPNYSPPYTNIYVGLLDDVRAYHRTLSDSEVMAIYEMPHSAFVTKNHCFGDSIRFTDSSITTSGSSYLWRFGDNSTSSKQNPGHLYAKPGNYNVTLVVTSPYKSVDSVTKSITVNPLPSAHFAETINNYKNQVSFTPYDTTNSLYSWDFGDSNSSNQKKPVHTYKYFGIHTITLNVTNSNGCDSTYHTTLVIYQPPIAAMGIKNTCEFSNTQFTDSSFEPDPSTYSWNFGDNTGSSQKSPVHIYSDSGTYKINFKVTTSHGLSDSVSKTITIHELPRASYTYKISKNTVTFSPAINTLTSYSWDFGDSTKSQAKDPEHAYFSAGTYTVSLTTQNTNGCDSTLYKTVVIEQNPQVSFKESNLCFGDTMHFLFTGAAPAGSVYSWNFGDSGTSALQNPGHTYKNPGSYVVSLMVTNQQGSSNTVIAYVDVLPLPVSTFTYKINATTYTFNPTDSLASTYNWDFGDQNSSNAKIPVHTFAGSGNFQVSLMVSQNGCSSTTKKLINVNDVPVASFKAANSCEGDTVVFSNTSTAPPSSVYLWNFGDGSNSGFINPTHIFSGTGKFKISLKVTNPDGKSDTVSMFITIYVTPSARFRAHINKYKVSFIASDSTLSAYSWGFGDSSFGSSKKPVHTYNNPGMYIVTLKTSNSNGCDSTFVLPITIDGTTGISENSDAENSILTIYPNPVENGILHIRYNISESDCRLQIVDVNGKILLSEQLKDNNIISTKDIDVSTYPPGIYCIRLSGQMAAITKKIVIR